METLAIEVIPYELTNERKRNLSLRENVKLRSKVCYCLEFYWSLWYTYHSSTPIPQNILHTIGHPLEPQNVSSYLYGFVNTHNLLTFKLFGLHDMEGTQIDLLKSQLEHSMLSFLINYQHHQDFDGTFPIVYVASRFRLPVLENSRVVLTADLDLLPLTASFCFKQPRLHATVQPIKLHRRLLSRSYSSNATWICCADHSATFVLVNPATSMDRWRSV
jgi:hypothetical protein